MNENKIMICSDIHGSLFFMKKIIEKMKEENADKLIILGDLYYHGPRNPLTQEYNPMGVSEILNSIKEKLVVIKGNCDSEVDQMISEFKFIESKKIEYGGKIFFLTHGHVYNENNIPNTNIDVLMYGHFHTGFIKEKNGLIICNPGSVSLPKNNTESSYILLSDNKIILKNIQGKTIEEKELN